MVVVEGEEKGGGRGEGGCRCSWGGEGKGGRFFGGWWWRWEHVISVCEQKYIQ